MNSEQLKQFYSHEFPLVQTAGAVQMKAITWIKRNIPVGSTIFEFGCNVGANLALLGDYNVQGCDISMRAVNSRVVPNVTQGGVKSLDRYADSQFDLVFTCSVLCHIPEDVQEQVARIGRQALFVETTEISDINYYSHDYKGKKVFKIKSPRDLWYKGYLR